MSGDRPAEVLRLAQGVRDELAAQARSAAPRECCGLLVGALSRIERCVPTANLDDNPSRFLIDPAAHIRLNRELRGTGRAIVGVYHSHPRGGPEPSASDVAEALYPDFVHLIISAVEGESPVIRAYRIIRGIISEIGLEEESGGDPS